ncbi:hypothetical protein [Geomonas sp.]|uniref:hypothetical protein n=1 Tax=Geomonas sp. TaxID=2651584 RepID=UPI002B48B581|nr:hypothetical protein [Geomonas sp.]HJV36872.1 hypothetical protein [Geomonas sp.]
MVLGFNHNIRYKGEVFHVQTEDSGKANPHIITLLYRGGTILASAKTSYADIIKVEQLEQVVESIMKEQHKDMMRRLKAGEFDARAFPNGVPQGAPAAAEPGATEGGRAAAEPVPARATAQAVPAPAAPQPSTASQSAPAVTPASPGPPAGTNPTSPPASPTKRSLDEVILDYLITGEEK